MAFRRSAALLILLVVTMLSPSLAAPIMAAPFGTVFTSEAALADAAARASRYPLNLLARKEALATAQRVYKAGGREGDGHFAWEHGPLYLAYAYRLTGDSDYAELAARVLKERIFAEAPQLEHRTAHSLAAGNEVLMRGQRTTFRAQTFALLQIYDGPDWSQADKERVRAWLGDFGRDLRDGFAPGSCITNAKWFHLEAIAAAGAVSQDQALLDFAFARYRRYLDEATCGGVRVIGPSGHMEHEMRRFKLAGDDTWYYAGYSLLAMTRLAEIARNQGVNLYDYATPDGRSLKQALDTHIQYFVGETWPHQGGEVSFPTLHRDFAQAYELAYAYWRDEAFLKVLSAYGDRRRATDLTNGLGPAAYLYANTTLRRGRQALGAYLPPAAYLPIVAVRTTSAPGASGDLPTVEPTPGD